MQLHIGFPGTQLSLSFRCITSRRGDLGWPALKVEATKFGPDADTFGSTELSDRYFTIFMQLSPSETELLFTIRSLKLLHQGHFKKSDCSSRSSGVDIVFKKKLARMLKGSCNVKATRIPQEWLLNCSETGEVCVGRSKYDVAAL